MENLRSEMRVQQNAWEKTARDMIKKWADEWERTELKKIKQRYEKVKELIDSWEDKKRKKAKRKLMKQQSELEKRLKSLEKDQNKMKYVKLVADGATAKAEESQKKIERELERERSKSKEKFKNKMKNVNLVAAKARAKAVEIRKYEALQAIKKASTIPKTGKLPQMYFCFGDH